MSKRAETDNQCIAERVASLLGKEDALFLSGTMSKQIAFFVHSRTSSRVTGKVYRFS